MAICWVEPVPLAFRLCCFIFSAVLVVRVRFPFGVWGRVWNLIASLPDHCLFIYFPMYQERINSESLRRHILRQIYFKTVSEEHTELVFL